MAEPSSSDTLHGEIGVTKFESPLSAKPKSMRSESSPSDGWNLLTVVTLGVRCAVEPTIA